MRKIKRRNAQRKILPKLISAAVIAACMGGLGYLVASHQGKSIPDKQGCYKEVSVGKQVHALIDNSEPRFSISQNRSIIRYFDNSYDELEFGDKISIHSTGDNVAASISKSSFHICKPATTQQDLEKINAEKSSDGYLAKQKERLYKQFSAKLEGILAKDLDTDKKASSSPILEIINQLSRLPSLKSGGKLVVISDMIQNSDTSQFCAVRNAMPVFSSYRNWKIYQTRLKPKSLKNIAVDVLMLQRPKAMYGKYCSGESEVRAFWSDYFHANQANLNFIRIRTGG